MTGGDPNRGPVVVTGGSAGIGYALASHLHGQGFAVLATGRRPDCAASFDYDQLDMMSDRLTQDVDDLLDRQGWGTLDTLVLNAGLGHVGPVAQTPSDLADTLMRVNVTAPLELAHHLATRVTRRIVFVGSVAHKGPHPDFAIYAATKAALRGAVRSWQAEASHDAPFVQMIHPGPTESDMHDRAGLPDTPMRRLFTPAHVVARAMAKAMRTNRAEVRFGLGFTLRHAVGKLIT
ncbi:MAG: SDR family NAD(P)-dependent oxidoreductase [Pseudomonadota bacterium]